MPRIKVKDIVFDEAIYPRSSWGKDTVKFYMERLMAGEKPPPLILEAETNRLLDGKHRLEANRDYATWWKTKAAKEEKAVFPKPSDEMDVEYEDIPEDIPAKLWCAQYNRDHGERISREDGRKLARELFEANPKHGQGGAICTCLGVPQSTVSDWTKDLRAKENQKRDWDIEILRRLGWTQAEIAEAAGVTRRRVGQLMEEIPEAVKLPKTQLAKTRQIEDVATAYNMSIQLATALDLDRVREDGDRAKQLGVNIRPHDVWLFSGFRELFGHEGYPGRIPGDLMANLLYFYTRQNDLIVDPMAGSGTTADVCLVMDRRCYCYDVVNKHNRPEIRPHDLYRDGWPPRTEDADMIFWDPPYFWKQDDSQVDNGYGEKSISKLDREKYLAFFTRAFQLAHEVTKATCTLALLMADWYEYEAPEKSIYIWDYAKRIAKAGWYIDRQIQIPFPSHLRPHVYEQFYRQRHLASKARYLLIAKKRA